MKRLLLIFGILVSFARCAGGPVVAPPNQTTVDCQTVSSPKPPPWLGAQSLGTDTWNYCYQKGAGKWTLVYLHGYTNDVHAWQTMGGLSSGYFSTLQKLQAMWSLNPPDVVVISYASGLTSQLLSPLTYRSQNPVLARVEHFMTVALPLVESRYGLSGRPRILWGMSQGGHSAAELTLLHPELWKASVIQHPVVESVDPFNLLQLCKACPLIEMNFWASDWPKVDPMQIALTVDVSKLPPILVTGATADDFGLHDPDQAFYTRLKLRGANVAWFEDVGGHNDWTAEPINTFVQGFLK